MYESAQRGRKKASNLKSSHRTRFELKRQKLSICQELKSGGTQIYSGLQWPNIAGDAVNAIGELKLLFPYYTRGIVQRFF